MTHKVVVTFYGREGMGDIDVPILEQIDGPPQPKPRDDVKEYAETLQIRNAISDGIFGKNVVPYLTASQVILPTVLETQRNERTWTPSEKSGSPIPGEPWLGKLKTRQNHVQFASFSRQLPN